MIKIFPFIFLINCAPPCSNAGASMVNGYGFETNFHLSGSGVVVDIDPHLDQEQLDLFDLDDRLMSLESCLTSIDWSEIKLSCAGGTPKDFECLSIKITSEWVWSCDGEQQLLLRDAPQSACNAKRFEQDDECSCRYRGGIQDYGIAVFPPQLSVLEMVVTQYISNCHQVYSDPQLAACVRGVK